VLTLARKAFTSADPSGRRGCDIFASHADVAELVDAHGSGPCRGNPVEVRVLSSALLRWLSVRIKTESQVRTSISSAPLTTIIGEFVSW
jgi:hypothetical protein